MSEYKDDTGVNLELGDDVSQMLYEASKYTHDIRPDFMKDHHKSFSGLKTFPFQYFNRFPGVEGMLDSDGVGTKVEISERLEEHRTVAFDLFAMACDDAPVRGGEPVAITSVLDTSQLKDPEYVEFVVRQLAEGYVKAAQEAGVVIVGGEFAELGKRVSGYGDYNYNWAATVLWAAHDNRLISGSEVKPGDTVVGLAENGFRSNGLTDVRNILSREHGPEWHNSYVKSLGQLSLGKLVQTPSIIYSRFINSLSGGFDISVEPKAQIGAVAHITGGGIPGKFGRALQPSGYGAIINEPLNPPEVMRYVQEIGGMPDEIAYRKWNMGTGMIVVTREPEKVVGEASEFNIRAKIIGEIIEEPGITIANRGVEQKENFLRF